LLKSTPRRVFPGTLRQALLLRLLVSIGPLVLVQIGIYVAWYRAEYANELNSNLELARVVSTAFDNYLHDLLRQEEALGTALTELPAADTRQANDYLRHVGREYQAARAWHWVDLKGRIVASSDAADVGDSIQNQEYFQKVLSGEPWWLSDFLSSTRTEEPTIMLARRIAGDDDKLLGIMVAEVDPRRLSEFTLRIQPTEHGAFTVFDRRNRLVYVYPEVRSDVIGSDWANLDPQLREVRSGAEEAMGRVISPLDGQQRIAARVTVGNTGWVVGASRPLAVVMRTVVRSLWIVAIINLAVIVFSATTALAFSRRILKVLGHLQSHAQAFGQGDLESRMDVVELEEFEQLAETFNLMADQIRERQQAAETAMADLRRSNQELEQFAYVASHDLQEPLRVISGYVQLIQRRYRGKIDADADQFIDYTVEAAHRLQQLINDLLEYSRIGSRGRAMKPTEAEAALATALDAMQRAIGDADAKITHDPLPIVLADAAQLARVFQNLIGNAIKYHRECAPEIHVSAVQDGDLWQFSVRDNGIGIDPAYWSQIFLIFQRLHTRQQYSGTGIGLSICKRIVERHGGRIWIES